MVWAWGSRRRESGAGAMESDARGPQAQNIVTLFFPVFVPSFIPSSFR